MKILLSLSALIALLWIGYFLQITHRHSSVLDSEKVYRDDSVMEPEQDGSRGVAPSLPIIRSAKLQLESTGDTDRVRVMIAESPIEKKNITYNYEWLKNGQPFGENEDHATGFKKGDKVDVRITPFDGKRYGRAVLLNFTIARVPPKIIENKMVSFDGNVLLYQVKAVDPDGGTLSYSLADAPKDMTIDSRTGTIKWQPKTDEDGIRKVAVRIKNDSGAELLYPLSISIAKAAE